MEESNVCLYKFELHLHNSMSISNCKKVNTKRVLLPKPDNAEINLVSNYKLKSIFIHSGYVCHNFDKNCFFSIFNYLNSIRIHLHTIR